MPAAEAAEGRRAAEAVLAEAASRIATRVEARNHLPAQIENLPIGVDPYARIGIVQRGRMPGGEEGRPAP